MLFSWYKVSKLICTYIDVVIESLENIPDIGDHVCFAVYGCYAFYENGYIYY